MKTTQNRAKAYFTQINGCGHEKNPQSAKQVGMLSLYCAKVGLTNLHWPPGSKFRSLVLSIKQIARQVSLKKVGSLGKSGKGKHLAGASSGHLRGSSGHEEEPEFIELVKQVCWTPFFPKISKYHLHFCQLWLASQATITNLAWYFQTYVYQVSCSLSCVQS